MIIKKLPRNWNMHWKNPIRKQPFKPDKEKMIGKIEKGKVTAVISSPEKKVQNKNIIILFT